MPNQKPTNTPPVKLKTVTPPPIILNHPQAQYVCEQAVDMFQHAVHHHTPHTFQLHSVNAVLDPTRGKEEHIKQLIAGQVEGQDSTRWHSTLAHEYQLAQGYGITKGAKFFFTY